MATRQTIKKIQPNQRVPFDAQFWPVVTALVVLSGITTGAILTMMRGPWMWGSLLALPILVVATIAVLQRLDNRHLRRALQFAIVISMAVHILILMIASVTNLFGSTRTELAPETRKRPQRVILTNRSDEPRIWERVIPHDVADPELEVERQTATNSPPQPIPIKSKPKETDSLVAKTAERSQTVPRFDESLSQLRSSTSSKRRNNARNSPTTSPTVSRSSAKPTKAAATSTETSSPSEAKLENKKRADAKPLPTRSAAAPTKTADSKPKARETAPSAQRAKTQTALHDMAIPSHSTARIRRSELTMPKSTMLASNETAKTSSAKTPAETAPKEVTEPITRRESKSIADRRTVQDLPTKQSTPLEKIAQSISRRRESQPAPPSLSNPSANPTSAKRARRNSPITASPQPIEAPSIANRSNNTGQSRIQPTAASVTQQRSTAAGSAISKNVGSNSGSIPSTASRASDTAARRESSSTDAPLALNATQRSNVRRSVANKLQVESAFKSNTSLPAKIMGSKTPTRRTATSAATTIDSASTAHRSEISAQRGQSQLDIGPTKVVTETAATRTTGGGGQPINDDLRLEPVAKTRASRGGSAPTLAADPGEATVAKSDPNSKPTASNLVSPTETRVASDRQTRSESMAGQPTESTHEGPRSDHSDSDVEGLLAEDRQRRSSDSAPRSDIDEDEEDKFESLAGNARNRFARAPSTDSTARTGTDEAETDRTASAGQVTTAANDRLLTGRMRSNRAPTAGKLTDLSAVTQRPSIESGSTRSTTNDSQQDPSSELGDVTALKTESNRRDQRPGTAPSLSTSPAEIAGTPNAGRLQQGTDLTATETNIEIDRGDRTGSIELQIAASEGPAGLTEDPSTRLGVRARPASRESDDIQSNINTRFRRNHSGAKPGLNPDAVIAKKAYRRRTTNQGGGGPKTEASIELGLEFLIRHQNPNGSWSLGKLDTEHRLHAQQLNTDAAATGLAVLAFQGAGYNHREFKYSLPLNHAIDWLIANQRKDGCLYVPSDEKSNSACRMYTHSIATLALTEAYGMTQDAKLREPIEQAIAYIEQTQDKSKGGWRYHEAVPNGSNNSSCRSTDTSVTGWMLMALQSARLSGFEVKPRTFERIENWLDVAQAVENPGLFRYDPFGEDSAEISRAEGRKASPTMTSVGLLMRLYLDWDREDERFQRGVAYLLKNMPSDTTARKRDTYYWYYATQVMRHAGGENWKQWNKTLHPLLVDTQEQEGALAGSWNPYAPIPDRWGATGGRIYVTTMNLLSLEVDYRLLPLYEDSSR